MPVGNREMGIHPFEDLPVFVSHEAGQGCHSEATMTMKCSSASTFILHHGFNNLGMGISNSLLFIPVNSTYQTPLG